MPGAVPKLSFCAPDTGSLPKTSDSGLRRGGGGAGGLLRSGTLHARPRSEVCLSVSNGNLKRSLDSTAMGVSIDEIVPLRCKRGI